MLTFKADKININEGDVIILTFYSKENDFNTIQQCSEIWAKEFPNNHIIINFDTLVKSIDVVSRSKYEENEFLKP